ncbi:MAG TPA: TonB-dependent vitamin B12 receptor [Thiohalobacter sp.]|nr:TonB-dependent vitamin B12 receptor [Thiohalobacter sp.]
MQNSRLSIAALLLSGLVPAQAEEIDPVIVTATRTAQTADATLAPVTVIDREAIERSNAKSLPELLRGTPGVDFVVQGGYGKNSSLFLRGTNADQVLVLIDGVRMGSATTGQTAFQHLPIGQIERIEIVRGPRAALYGSEAIGGVIQIFTRQAPQQRFRGNAEAGYGTHDTRRLNGGFGGEFGGGERRTRYRVQVERFDTRGIDVKDETDPENDNDGYENTSISASLEHEFNPHTKADLRLLRAQGETEFDGSFVNETDFVQQSLSAGLQFAPNDIWDMQLRLGETRDEAENFLNGSSSSEFDTRRLQASWQNDVVIGGAHLLTLGTDYRNDRIDSTSDFAEDSRYNIAGFAQLQLRLGGHDLLLALRHDDNEAFGGNTTGNIEWGYGFANGLRLTAGYGTAFRAPSFNELFFPGFGNPDLDPEESESWELGLSRAGERFDWKLRLFRTEVDDLIETVNTGGFVFEPRNVSKAEIEGVEATLATELAGWQLQANATVLDPRNEDTGRRLRRRSPRSFNLDIDRQLGRWALGLHWRVQDARFEDSANQTRLGGYGVLDLRLGYTPVPDWSLALEVDNALDKEYQTAEGFNTLDRTVMLNLSYRPDRH